MRVSVKRREGESLAGLLRRFTTRVQKSGLLKEVKSRRFYKKKPGKTQRHKSRLYRLKIQSFVAQKLKEGWSLEKALAMARRYIDEIKYRG